MNRPKFFSNFAQFAHPAKAVQPAAQHHIQPAPSFQNTQAQITAVNQVPATQSNKEPKRYPFAKDASGNVIYVEDIWVDNGSFWSSRFFRLDGNQEINVSHSDVVRKLED